MLTGIFKLVRISALPSAWADVFGGSALALASLPWIATPSFAQDKLPWLLLTTLGIYLGGMGLNDLLHRHKDAALNKPRPLVTGAISVEAAALLTASLYSVGLGAGIIAGCSWPALLLAVMTVLYNFLALGKVERGQVKLHPALALAGVLVLAACRAVNVSLPLIATAGSWQLAAQSPAWPIMATCVFAYFGVVTLVSLFEDRGGGRAALWFVQAALLPTIFWLPLWAIGGPDRGHWIIEDLLPLLCATLLYLRLTQALTLARNEPTPRNLGRCVGLGIRGECFLMGAFALALLPTQPLWGTAALLCYPAAALASRWVSPT